MRLKVLGNYTNNRVHYPKGQEIDVSEAEGAYLLRDAPENFKQVEIKAEQKAPAGPPNDKADKATVTK